MNLVTWVLESDIFSSLHGHLRDEIKSAGQNVVSWNDDWWTNNQWPLFSDTPIVFHGSLGNAALISERLPWRPGSWCNTSRFYCNAWYGQARPWLLHTDWRILPANEFVESKDSLFDLLGSRDTVFVRPDSPLKPFSGRVANRDNVSLDALDYGFYYEDEKIPVVVAPVRNISREWRFVIARQKVVAGSAYEASSRSTNSESLSSDAWAYAQEIAQEMIPPEEVYVMDICESDSRLRLLELNPFSGADLYASDPKRIVSEISKIAYESWSSRNPA